MGTRADFYVGRGDNAEWLGSVAWDGYPSGLTKSKVLTAKDEATFRKLLSKELERRGDASLPKHGWPWPWDDSRTTDYAYAFDSGVVWGSCFGGAWVLATSKEEDWPEDSDKSATFPNMKARQSVALGERSGLMVFVATKSKSDESPST